MRLHTDWGYLEQEFGSSIRDRFLMAVRSLDNPRAVTPFLVERAGKRFGLFLHVEKGNVESARLPPDIAPVFYRPYFTFEASEKPPHVHQTLTDAVEAVAGGERSIVLDRFAPIAVAVELESRFSVQVEDAPLPGTVTLREVACSDVAGRLSGGRPAGAKAALKLLDRSPVRDRLAPYLGAHADARFQTLEAAIGQAGLAGLVVSSTLNMQEIAGVPVGAKHRPLAVIYVTGEKHVWIMEPGRAPNGREFTSPAEALRHLCAEGRIGVETEDLGVGMAHALGLASREYKPADRLVRKWRDESTLPDLPYYVIATRITRHAIEAALDFAASALRRGASITEMDPYAVYLRAMHEFASRCLPGARVTRTLTNFHGGRRSIFPSNAGSYPVDGGMNTLKIDAGCLLFDANGILLGCSDIARTLAIPEEATELYQIFERGVRQTLIPGAAAGRTGNEVYAEGVEAVWGRRGDLEGNSLFVDLVDPAREYDRDVGHLLGKNNLAHLRLVRGEEQKLAEGMIACCEYQWPLRGHAIAYEDTCLVTKDGGLNITSDGE